MPVLSEPRTSSIHPPVRHLARVVANRRVARETGWLELECPEIARRADWGQFVMIGFGVENLDPPLLPRPFSVGWRGEDGRLGLLVRVFGAGSLRLAGLRRGDEALLLGPLGRPFHLVRDRPVVCVAGGVGLAPFLFLAGEARRAGFDLELLYGERTAEWVFDPELIEELTGAPPRVWTEDGSRGRAGRVTDELEADEGVTVLGCGPTPMLRALALRSRRERFPLQVSVEEHMACGMGTCQGCVVAGAEGRWLKACMEGPVFDADKLSWPPG